jgi:hypothetical protein
MKKLLKTILAASIFVFAIASPVMAVITPQTAAAASGCEGRVLGIPPWYRGLTENNPPKCDMTPIGDDTSKGEIPLQKYIWKIVLNGIEMALVIVSYIAAFFILYGGFLFMTGGDNPSQVEKARKTILNAVIGLVIAMAVVALNNLIFSIIK